MTISKSNRATVRAAAYAHGGPKVTTRSRFLKPADVFRTGIERQDYAKSGKGSELSGVSGETKSIPRGSSR